MVNKKEISFQRQRSISYKKLLSKEHLAECNIGLLSNERLSIFAIVVPRSYTQRN
jgi:hypothetical protein